MSGELPTTTALGALEGLKSRAEEIGPGVLQLLGDAALLRDPDTAHRVSTTLSEISDIIGAIQVECDNVVDTLEGAAETDEPETEAPEDAPVEAAAPRPATRSGATTLAVKPPATAVSLRQLAARVRRPAFSGGAARRPFAGAAVRDEPVKETPEVQPNGGYPHAGRAIAYAMERGSETVTIGRLAYHLNNRKRMKPGAFDEQRDFLNSDPHFQYLSGGTYRIIANTAQPETAAPPLATRTTPRRSRTVRRVS